MSTLWVIRAGRGGKFVYDFIERHVIAFGEREDLTRLPDKQAVFAAVRAARPDMNRRQCMTAASQGERFVREMRVGDRVALYDPSQRHYHLGTITGEVRYEPGGIGNGDDALLNIRPVDWDAATVRRSALSVPARNTLGAILTLFQPNADVAAELEAVAQGGRAPAVEAGSTEEEVADEEQEVEAIEELGEEMAARARELVADRLERLDWDDMQELFAAVLRAMGYKTLVSPAGPDRGKDIVASPDGLGLQEPRIKVEVKHRAAAMGAPEVRSFLGGLRPGDRGVFLSTGGFSREARYEAERAQVPLTLLGLDELVTLIFEHYPTMDERGRTLVPLQRLWWPLA